MTSLDAIALPKNPLPGVYDANDGYAPLERWSKALDLRALQSQLCSPTYLLCEAQLRANFDAWSDLVRGGGNVCYPVKANPSPAVLELIAAWGGRAECASYDEVRLARLCGFADASIVYGTPAPDIAVACELLARGGAVVVDSKEFLEQLDEAVGRSDLPLRGKALLRVNPSWPIHYASDHDWQSLTSHGSATGKFGIPAEDIVRLAKRCEHLRISGLHTHVGTQMDHVEPFVQALKRLTLLSRELSSGTRHRIDTLDLGGGLGIPFTPTDKYPSIDHFGSALKAHFIPEMTYWVEPGHALVGDAVALLATIVAKKTMRDHRWAISDAGTNQLAKVTLLQWRHQILGPDNVPLPMSGPDSLGGPLCFSGDVLLPETDISSLEVGDPILVQHAGAYCAALGNSFNGRKIGETAVLRPDGKIQRIAEAERESGRSAILKHRWGFAEQAWSATQPLETGLLDRLCSSALKDKMDQDGYEYLSVERSAPRSFLFAVKVTSRNPFITMPLLIRIAGDAAIISSLACYGQNERCFPVWGVNQSLCMPENIPSDELLRLRIDASAIASGRHDDQKRVIVRFGVLDTAIAGAFDLRFVDKAATDTSLSSGACSIPVS